MLLPLPRSGGGRFYRFFLIAFMLLASSSAMWAQLSATYCFNASTGTAAPMGGATSITVTSDDDGYSPVYNIGFDFVFNGSTYTQFSVGSNGTMKLGPTSVTNTRFNENFPTSAPAAGDYPFLAPFWDDLYLRGSKIRYVITGSAPNRMLAVEWEFERYSANNSEDMTMQVRLYERSNKIEFFYGTYVQLTSTPDAFNGLIAIAASNSNYMRVEPVSNSYFTTGNVAVGLPAQSNTLYTFGTYYVDIAGNPAQGGTAAMNSGDELLSGVLQDPATSKDYFPFTVTSVACGPANFTYTLGGAHPGDYQITPGSVSLPSGTSQSPRVTFTPQGPGLRDATLTVSDGRGFNRTYKLMARAARLIYTGNVPQGGVTGMADGSTLMTNIRVRRLQSGAFTPFSVSNIDTDPSGPAVTVTYTIAGLSGGQYSIAPGSVAIGPGQTSTPVITFSPTGVGVIEDELTVTTSEGTSRKFKLRGTSIAPAARFTVSDVVLDSASNLFGNQFSCTSTDIVTIPIKVKNIGTGDFKINGLDMFLTDTTYQQGRPAYPFLRDRTGRLLAATDYFLTLQPGQMPYSANQFPSFPLVLSEGEERTIYLNFLSSFPGKRFGQVYLRTDGVNLNNADTAGFAREGLLRFGVYGRGYGASLSDNIAGGLPKAIVFPAVKVGESVERTLNLVNSGQCSLRVSTRKLTVTAGDVEEFVIVRMPNKYVDGSTGDLVLAPGERDSVVIRFTPKQGGSRRAGVRLATNDSTVEISGITERGVYYIDLYGIGLTDLFADGYNFGQALIGGTGMEQRHGMVRMSNSTNTPLTITKLEISGMDASEFMQDPAHPWPTLPKTLQPGDVLELWVIFAPAAGGFEGARNAELLLTTSNGQTVSGSLVGEAGTRTAMVNPTAVSFPVTTTGKYQRKMVGITNTGTMPLTLEQPEVIGPDAANFQISGLARLELAPGQTEFVEVTYVPVAPGSASATLEFGGNMTNGPAQVQLSGLSVKTKKQDNDPSIALPGRQDVIEDGVGMAGGLENLSTSGVENGSATAMALRQSVPNPGREIVEISYVLARGSQVNLTLYDAQGRLVRVLDAGNRGAGEHTLRVDVRELAGGVYHYRLTSDGTSLTRSMSIVK